MNISLTIGNIPSNPNLDVYVVVPAPPGLSLNGNSCASTGQCTAIYELSGGQHQAMQLNATANQAGDFVLVAEVAWSSPGGTPVRSSMSLELRIVDPIEGETDVIIHATQTEVNMGEPVTLNLAATNSIAKPPMTLKFILRTPSGWALSGSGFTTSCAGQCIATYTVESGEQRNITLEMLPKQVGSVAVEARMEWYFGEDTSTLERKVESLSPLLRHRFHPSEQALGHPSSSAVWDS